jgi:hypothetical protein
MYVQVLVAWLSNMPNYNEITRWYLGWKAQIPDRLLQHPVIKGSRKKVTLLGSCSMIDLSL